MTEDRSDDVIKEAPEIAGSTECARLASEPTQSTGPPWLQDASAPKQGGTVPSAGGNAWRPPFPPPWTPDPPVNPDASARFVPPKWPADPPAAKPEPDAKRQTNGRYKKGQSGNPKGRPPLPVRSRSSRQFRRDLFAESERTIVVNGEKGPALRLVIRQMLQKAAEGDLASMRFVVQLYANKMSENEKANPELFEGLEMVERIGAKDGDERTDEPLRKLLNRDRKRSRLT